MKKQTPQQANKLSFKDFKPEELIGKLVLYTTTGSAGRSIAKISHVTKTGFRIEGLKESLFSLDTGKLKGGGVIHFRGCKCELITEEEAAELRIEWKKKREMKAMATSLSEAIDELTYEQLKEITAIITKP